MKMMRMSSLMLQRSSPCLKAWATSEWLTESSAPLGLLTVGTLFPIADHRQNQTSCTPSCVCLVTGTAAEKHGAILLLWPLGGWQERGRERERKGQSEWSEAAAP